MFVSSLVLFLQQPGQRRFNEPKGYLGLPLDLRQPPDVLKTFELDKALSGSSSGSRDAWNSLMPPGRGYIPIDNPSMIGLGPGVPVSGTVEKFAISAFHQLHCLTMLREAYYNLLGASGDAHDGNAHGHMKSSEAHQHHWDAVHLDHCFDYLRQAIMCAADPAVEPARTEFDGTRFQVDGWGGEHQCRSWEKLVDYAVSHKLDDEMEQVIPDRFKTGGK
ncbi:hypothetical protein GQ53DRAFT_828080 [Thozetella sp. PMI_491]|nr:hypothetical protein GQ53DRAFT_828080 [Thozetella sp. PMI_491]